MNTAWRIGACLAGAMTLGSAADAMKNQGNRGAYNGKRSMREPGYVLANFDRPFAETQISKEHSVSIKQSREVIKSFLEKNVQHSFGDHINFELPSSVFPVSLLSDNSVVAGIENFASGVQPFKPPGSGYRFVPEKGFLNNVIFEVNKRFLVGGGKTIKDSLTSAQVTTPQIAYSILSMMEKVAATGIPVTDKEEQSRLLQFGLAQITKALNMRNRNGTVPTTEIQAFIKYFPDLVARATQGVKPGRKNVRALLDNGGTPIQKMNPLVAVESDINKVVKSYRKSGE